jgi:ankyrin repeat protein
VAARHYDFADWPRLAESVAAVTRAGSPVALFEAAVEAVVTGDVPALESLLREHPDLVRARSTRVTHFDAPVHRATLLHYIAANGVEQYRQKTPPNAVEIATILLRAGAEVDALASAYGTEMTTMNLLVSSAHPAKAGLQAALAETLLDFGADIDRDTPLLTALAFGYTATAEVLVRRGARVTGLPATAGLGRLTEAAQFLRQATGEERHRALALAALHGHEAVVRLLLDAGEDPNRYNPKGNHAHSTPLHQVALAGHEAVVRLLVERGARLDIKDTVWEGTPLGWALHNGQSQIAEYLRAHGAE